MDVLPTCGLYIKWPLPSPAVGEISVFTGRISGSPLVPLIVPLVRLKYREAASNFDQMVKDPVAPPLNVVTKVPLVGKHTL